MSDRILVAAVLALVVGALSAGAVLVFEPLSGSLFGISYNHVLAAFFATGGLKSAAEAL